MTSRTDPTPNPDAQMRIGALREAVIGVFAQACCQLLTVRDVVDALVFDGFDYTIFPACRSVVIDPAKLDKRHVLTKARLIELAQDNILHQHTIGEGELAWRVVPGAIDQLPPVDPDHVCTTSDQPATADDDVAGEPDTQPTIEPFIDSRGPLRPLRQVRADIAAVAVPVVSPEAIAALAAHRRTVAYRRRVALLIALAVTTVLVLVATLLTA